VNFIEVEFAVIFSTVELSGRHDRACPLERMLGAAVLFILAPRAFSWLANER
jgi:hypothetical protein